MAVVKVIQKHSEIDGKPISWNVLTLTGYLAGDFQTLEVKLDRTQAMLAGMLLNTDEKAPEVNGRNATEEEKKNFSEDNELGFLDS